MEQFERDRELYYLDWINISNKHHLGEFYKRMFLEIFHPQYRAVKKMYDGYAGGWYRNENGFACADHIAKIDRDKLNNGDICLEIIDDSIHAAYVYKNDMFCKLNC